MNSRLFWVTFLFAGLVAGCAMNPSVDTLTGEQKAKLNTIKILRSKSTRQNKVIEPVSGLSCQESLHDLRVDSEKEAIERVKVKALLLGADAVINTTCQNSELQVLSTCWSLIECSGDAVKFIDNN